MSEPLKDKDYGYWMDNSRVFDYVAVSNAVDYLKEQLEEQHNKGLEEILQAVDNAFPDVMHERAKKRR